MNPERQALTIRRMSSRDLPAAYQLQLDSYPAFLIDRQEAFASRLRIDSSCCLVARRNGVLAGYLLAHGWLRHAPPGVNEVLPLHAPNEILYLHDLSVSPSARGLGLGRLLVQTAFKLAPGAGLAAAELIAVDGASGFWLGLGFSDGPVTPELAEKVAAYGSGARWMSRTIAMAEEQQSTAT